MNVKRGNIMIKDKYSISFNCDELSPGIDTVCTACHFNINKVTDVECITCIAKGCDKWPDAPVIDKQEQHFIDTDEIIFHILNSGN